MCMARSEIRLKQTFWGYLRATVITKGENGYDSKDVEFEHARSMVKRSNAAMRGWREDV